MAAAVLAFESYAFDVGIDILGINNRGRMPIGLAIYRQLLQKR